MANFAGQRPVIQNRLFIEGEEMRETPRTSARPGDPAFEDTDALVSRLLLEEKRQMSPQLFPELLPQDEDGSADKTKSVLGRIKPKANPDAAKSVARKRFAFSLPTFSLSKRFKRSTSEPVRPKPDGQETKQKPVARKAASKPAAKTGVVQAPAPDAAAPKRLAKKAPPKLREQQKSGPVKSRTQVSVKDSAPAQSKTAGEPKPSMFTKIRRKHVIWAAVAGIIIWRPWLLPFLALVLFWVALIIYLSLGPKRLQELVVGWWLRLKKRNPDTAEALRARADRFAERLDHWLDYLPESWADRLALPDFSTDYAKDGHPDPFDRLSSETR